MVLKKIRLGNYITPCEDKNDEEKLNLDSVKGISNQKFFIETKANMNNVSLNSYKIVKRGQFSFNPNTARMGDKICIAYNNTEKDILVSAIYPVFEIKDKTKLSPEYLMMFFMRNEFDRYVRFHSWGSAREVFNWNDICDIEIDLPDLSIQQKFVNIYLSILANQKSYEYGLNDLKLVCDAYIENLMHKIPCESIGPFIERCDIRNGKNGIKKVMGVSTSKEFREPTSKVNRNELTNYKVVKPRQISFVQTTHNEKVFAYAFNDTGKNIVVTSVNEVFYTKEDKLLPEYLSMFFNRTEFDRYARFHSWGSAREIFTWQDLIKVEIPIANMTIQESIVNIYKVYKQRKKINEQLKIQLKDICSILIKGSIQEAKAS